MQRRYQAPEVGAPTAAIGPAQMVGRATETPFTKP